MPHHTIGFAAKAAGVGFDPVRYDEREGLLSRAQRTASGQGLWPLVLPLRRDGRTTP